MELKTTETDFEGALADSENRFRCLVEYASDGYLLYDGDGRLVDVNSSACEAYGYSREELAGISLHELVAEDGSVERLTAIDEELCGGGAVTVEMTARCKDGRTFPAEVRVGLLESRSGRLFMALVRDVSERERSRERIEYLSGHDELTELPNCRLFSAETDAAVARARRAERQVAVLHVDLNRFSLVNQGLGSAGGDELLRQTAGRLREAARPMDVVARYAADEFLILAADLEPEASPAGAGGGGAIEAHALADAVHGVFERPFDLDGNEVFVDAAVGISLFPLDADSASVLLRHADAAAAQAKRPGEGPTHQFAEETSDKWGRLWLATRLRKAIDANELRLHYQPIVNLEPLSPGEGAPEDLRPHVVGLEALVRWQDRDGLVPPAGFISLAEDIGLIDQIGQWVVRESCRQALEWQRAGARVGLSFNLSLRELWQPDIVERIAGEVRGAGLEPGAVTVEITETSAMTDPTRTERVLYELRRHGFGLAIDDFGAGHSSFSRLAELPCEVLKIDRSFVARLPGDASSAAMVTAMLELAERLGMRAIAEGIETAEQLDFLLARGCPLGQGFLFGRPVPPEQLRLT
jgi:PAS domain S-box-containing protein/diguanylate cyclase (GGDEF)-like protein